MTYEPNFSLLASTQVFLQYAVSNYGHLLPAEVQNALQQVDLVGVDSDLPLIPCPYQETEAITSLKMIEAAYALTLLQKRGDALADEHATIDINHATGFLFLAFQSTIDGIDKLQPEHYARLFDTDLHQSQSNPYRLAMTNIFKTQDGYFQFHGGLNASITLKYLGLDEFRSDLTEYEECCKAIEQRTKLFSNAQLTELCRSALQAGSPVFTRTEYLESQQGKIESQTDWMKCDAIEFVSPAVPLKGKYLLSDIKILDLTRVIAGPLIGRTLAEYGADVLRVHNTHLPDVPYYQVDLNYGKHATHIDLKTQEGRETFDLLLNDADVIIDGYRPGALKRLGYGPKEILRKTQARGKGFIYLSENCHGWDGPLYKESGWQQIADASCGMSAAQGAFWRKEEPIAPPFPMADFGTGEMGAIAILHGLYLRSLKGGSYHMRVSLCAFNNFVMNAGQYSEQTQDALYSRFSGEFEDRHISHSSNFNRVGKTALDTMQRVSPQLWSSAFMTKSYSSCFGPKDDKAGALIRTQRGVVECPKKSNDFLRSTRYNGFDKPTWHSFHHDRFDNAGFHDELSSSD